MEGKNHNGGHACSSDKFHGGYGLTHLKQDHLKEKVQTDEVIVENDEGWEFQPGPDFGCIHHEPK
jgi:hypothetical protein